VSTRRLIITALVCGMAILVAGGAFLVRTARNRADLTVNVLGVGDQASVAALKVRVLKVTRRADVIVVGVEVDSRGAALAAPAQADEPWSMVIRTPRAPMSPTAEDGPACAGQQIAGGQVLSCVLAFANGDGAPFLAFSWQGRQAQWRLA